MQTISISQLMEMIDSLTPPAEMLEREWEWRWKKLREIVDAQELQTAQQVREPDEGQQS